MADFTYTVIVTANSKDEADQVMMERILFEEDYGFDYTINYEGRWS